MSPSDLVPPGVVVQPRTTLLISDQLERAVQQELDKAAPGTTTAALEVHTQRGVNLVIAAKNADGKLTAALWIGKSGWNEPLTEGWAAGVKLRGSWGGK